MIIAALSVGFVALSVEAAMLSRFYGELSAPIAEICEDAYAVGMRRRIIVLFALAAGIAVRLVA